LEYKDSGYYYDDSYGDDLPEDYSPADYSNNFLKNSDNDVKLKKNEIEDYLFNDFSNKTELDTYIADLEAEANDYIFNFKISKNPFNGFFVKQQKKTSGFDTNNFKIEDFGLSINSGISEFDYSNTENLYTGISAVMEDTEFSKVDSSGVGTGIHTDNSSSILKKYLNRKKLEDDVFEILDNYEIDEIFQQTENQDTLDELDSTDNDGDGEFIEFEAPQPIKVDYVDSLSFFKPHQPKLDLNAIAALTNQNADYYADEDDEDEEYDSEYEYGEDYENGNLYFDYNESFLEILDETEEVDAIENSLTEISLITLEKDLDILDGINFYNNLSSVDILDFTDSIYITDTNYKTKLNKQIVDYEKIKNSGVFKSIIDIDKRSFSAKRN
jgi:hypothetical protein